MKRHILYLAMLALGTAATGCSDDDTAKEGRTEPTTVESISIRTQMAEVSRAQTGDDDPTMGNTEIALEAIGTVTIGGQERPRNFVVKTMPALKAGENHTIEINF